LEQTGGIVLSPEDSSVELPGRSNESRRHDP
jgi:hypothetical protein